MAQSPELAPSASAKVLQFLEETQLSDDMALPNSQRNQVQNGSVEPDFLLTSNTDSDKNAIDNNNNKYKNMLRYKPNSGFHDEASSINGFSVPNTFKHKLHPNARTKPQIGTLFHETSAENALDSVLEEISETAVKTSTLRAKNGPADDEHTPNWMPSVLETRWDEQPLPEKSLTSRKESPLDFLNSASNTFVHNPNGVENGHATPMWKKVKDGYHKKSDPPLHHIFQASFDLSKDSEKPRQDSKAGVSGYTLMSTFSTPLATKDENHLTERQIVQLENMLEQVKDQPDDYPIIGLPLKLFGNGYDTFTKSVLNQFVEKVRSNANSVQRLPKAPSLLPKFELRITDFTKSKDYTDKDFMQNADNIFANLQKKGPDRLAEKPSTDSFHPSMHQNTATSTPKPKKVRSFTSSSSSDQMTMDSVNLDPEPTPYKYDYSADEYTAMDKTSYNGFTRDVSNVPDEYNSYTFDKVSDLNSEYTSELESEKTQPLSDFLNDTVESDAIRLMGSSMLSVRQYPREENKSASPEIKWKRPSQLRLSSANNLRRSSIVKGLVKPGEFPDHYGNMVLDPTENKWVSNDKENNCHGSLDSIEDLVTFSDTRNERARNTTAKPRFAGLDDLRDVSIMKRQQKGKKGMGKGSQKRKQEQNLEVSFQLPESSFGTITQSDHYDVTAVSALTNTTFSQSNKEIVSLITGSTDEAVWEKLTSIDLSHKKITHLESLDAYLPSLQTVDLSHNKLAFIEGLPSSVSELDVSENLLDNRVSFKKLHDLQILNASYNRLVNLSAFTSSHNLTQLNLMGNMISSIEELKSLRSLTSLNVSRNRIRGKVDFAKYDFSNLQEINLAENSVTSLQGLEHVPNLRVLNVNENNLKTISCEGKHPKLKKLCCKFNALKALDLQNYPFLRVLRVDGNRIKLIQGLNKLKFLQEVSAKCQSSSDVVEEIVQSARDVISMDLSGVLSIQSVLETHPKMAFYNLNVLNLSAVALPSLPSHFGAMFPNVRELNLNFNKFESLGGLSSLTRLRKLYLLSNNMSSMEDLMSSLQNSRRSLAVLDLRLNALNFRFYPYVFSPDELEHRSNERENVSESPIPIHAVDDIENFSIHYKAVMRGKEDWHDRDRAFFSQMVQEGKQQHVQDRISYESLLLDFFSNLKELDGTRVLIDKRLQLRLLGGVQEQHNGMYTRN